MTEWESDDGSVVGWVTEWESGDDEVTERFSIGFRLQGMACRPELWKRDRKVRSEGKIGREIPRTENNRRSNDEADSHRPQIHRKPGVPMCSY